MAVSQPDTPHPADYPAIGNEILQKLRTEQGSLPLTSAPTPAFTRADETLADPPPSLTPKVRRWPRIAAAAAVLLALSIGGFFILHQKQAPEIARTQPTPNDLPPAGARATLTLLDGKTILLDSTENTMLPQQVNTAIRSQDGQLIYSPGPTTTKMPATAYNTLTTSLGEHYSLTLPDGTRAWLNAGSSISYPIAFTGTERKVNITGEVYLEILHNPQQPFRIGVKDQTIDDLGTHLNINAYDDEPAISTTLIEGSIRIAKGSASTILKPGQQATIATNEKAFQISTIDPETAVAWKNGYFYFDRADIQTVMREMARWYNVQVIYKGALPKTTFKGKVYRNINASEALKILSFFGAHFQIEGKTIKVTS
jgi:ferric-dicitrate binding protein FerR (iron transport regulator)